MVQRVQALATKPDALSLIPRIHAVEGEIQLLNAVLELGAHSLWCVTNSK